MGMTMTQKILAAHAGLDYVEAGQLIEADLALFQIRISNRQSTVNVSGSLPVVMILRITLMWERWELNMLCSRKKD